MRNIKYNAVILGTSIVNQTNPTLILLLSIENLERII